MRVNQPPAAGPRTHEGGPAIPSDPFEQLWRTTMCCLLWEDGFYEDGEAVADRIKRLVPLCKPHEVAALAVEIRSRHKLRHVPLLLVRELARYPSRFSIANTLREVIQRPDELAEFLAIYWKEGRKPLAKQVKKGLAAAFAKFNEYSLAKYNRDEGVRLRDVLFLVHAKPRDEEQAALWKRLVEGKLETPDTWEVALSAGGEKKETFERLLREGKLGYLALLRNLRNMQEAGVDTSLVHEALLAGAANSKALPFRFLAAARAVPMWENVLDLAMQKALEADTTKLPGKTIILVDVSGSMAEKLSKKSDLTRRDAAAALSILLRGVCEEVRVFTFSDDLVEVPARRGMALRDVIEDSQPHSGTYLGTAVGRIAAVPRDRLIVFTDEESTDVVGSPRGRGYMVNVSTTENGVGFGDWTRITGFSEAVVQYIAALEAKR